MKKLLLFTTTFYSLFTFASINDPIINIPDANFKAKLLAASPSNTIASTQTPVYDETNDIWSISSYNKIDINNDGELQQSEALLIKCLNVNCFNCSSLQKIFSLDGIHNFSNLIFLSCGYNQLSNLSINNLYNLKSLSCGNNLLPSINIQGINLQSLNCQNNSLNTINLQGLTNLKSLKFGYNFLTNIIN